MKRIIIHSVVLCVWFLISGYVRAGNSDNGKIYLSNNQKESKAISLKNTGASFKKVWIFEFDRHVNDNDYTYGFVSNASLVNLNNKMLKEILRTKAENIIFEIPLTGNKNMELELRRSYPVSGDFKIMSVNGSGKHPEAYSEGLHYSGTIHGKENSIASVSIFENFVMGIISDETGNYVLGPIKNSDNSFSDKYIFYNDADLNVKSKFKCNVDDYEDRFTIPLHEINNDFSGKLSAVNSNRLPIKVYFQADYQMYLDGNQNIQTVGDFITGFFNSVKTIYDNENIPVEISLIEIWTSQDPYANLTTSSSILSSFGANTQDDFEGNIAHLLSTRSDDLGGVAWIRVLCAEYNSQNNSGRFAFSNIEPGYNIYPTYSWTVNVVAHEMGHNLGSQHTQACVWPIGGTIIGAIDSCYQAEGTCFLPSQVRPTIGTIMSYCHIWTPAQGGGVNLALGFGPLPGDTIRLRYLQAHCFDGLLNSSERPLTFDLAQNFPNPFNPNTVIRFALPNAAEVSLEIYDVNGRLVSGLIKSKYYDAGFYDIEFNAWGLNLSSGVYFYKFITKEFSETKRMVLIK